MGKFLLFIGAVAGAVWWFFFTPISEFKTIPPNFNYVFYINMDSALKNQYVKKGINDNTSLAKLPPEGRKMVQFIRKLMINSINDVYIAASDRDKKKMIAFINFKEKTDIKDFIKEVKDEFNIIGEPESKKYKESEYFLLDDKGICLAKSHEKQLVLADESSIKRSLSLKKNGGSSMADNKDLMKVCSNGRSKGSFWFAGADKKRSDIKALMIKCDVQNYNMEMEITAETNKFLAENAEKAFEAGGGGIKDLVVLKDFKRKETLITVSMKINISKMEKLKGLKF